MLNNAQFSSRSKKSSLKSSGNGSIIIFFIHICKARVQIISTLHECEARVHIMQLQKCKL